MGCTKSKFKDAHLLVEDDAEKALAAYHLEALEELHKQIEDLSRQTFDGAKTMKYGKQEDRIAAVRAIHEHMVGVLDNAGFRFSAATERRTQVYAGLAWARAGCAAADESAVPPSY